MYSNQLLAVVLLLSSCLATFTGAERIYLRHKRSLERENAPASESTVVIRSPNETANADLPKDFENEIGGGEKDCRDFLEFDYNPLNDSMWFNGRIPSIFHDHNHRGLSSFEQMFHRMLSQASQMFNRFPVHSMVNGSGGGNSYPDNYNGTVEEEVTINGQRFRKKQHVINKTSGGSKISIMSTVYEPVVDASPGSTLNPGEITPGASGAPSTPSESIPTSSTTTTAGGGDLTDGKIINYK